MKRNSDTNHRHHHMHQLALGVATLAVVGAVVPATQAQAFEVVNTKNQAVTYSVGKSTDSTTYSTESTTQATGSTVIDKSTAGNPNKALLHCVDQYTGKALEDVLVDYSYGYTAGGEVNYKYTKPVIAGYTSAAYYADGADVYFTTNTPGKTLEFTVKYRSTVQDTVGSWVQEGGVWYYRYANGVTVKGWLANNGKWYFLDRTTGAIKTGWVQDGSTWYYCYADGSMASNTVVDGYTLNASGAMV